MFGSLKEEKKVEYLELIYDLIFVYLIGRNSSLVHHIENGFVSAELFMTYVLSTLIIIQIWNYTTFFINRYGANGLTEHICIFINMYLLYYMADATRVHWHEYYYRYNVAWFLILLNLALQYFLQIRKRSADTPWETKQMKSSMWIILIEAFMVLAAIPIYAVTGLPFSTAAVVFGMIAAIVSEKSNRLVAVDFAHLTERAMLYVVFTFGEMIIAIASYFTGGFGFNTIYFSLMAFLIVAGLFLCYGFLYDHLIDRELSTTGTGYMMIHVFLIFALNNITTALEFMREEEVALIPKTIFLILSFLMYDIFMFLLLIYAKPEYKPKKMIGGFGLILGVFTVLMLVFYRQMYVNIAVSAVFVFLVYLLLRRIRRLGQSDGAAR